MRVVYGAWLQAHQESASRHSERREQLVHGLRQARGALRPLGGERRARACEVRRGRFALLCEVSQVEVRGIQQLELARGPIAGGEYVGECGTVLLGEAEQDVASRLDGPEPIRVALDGGGVGSRCRGALR